MTRGRKTGGRDFVKGDPRAGRKPLPEDVRKAKALDRVEFRRTLHEFLGMTKEEVQERLKRPETSSLELIVGSIIAKAAGAGDPSRLDFLMNHAIGRAPIEHRLGGTDGGPIRVSREDPASWTSEELKAATARLEGLIAASKGN